MIDISQLTSADIGRHVHNKWRGYAGLDGRIAGWNRTQIMVCYALPPQSSHDTSMTYSSKASPTDPKELEWIEVMSL